MASAAPSPATTATAATPAAASGTSKGGWSVPASDVSHDTCNPIRVALDTIHIPDKELIRLTLGDPTVFGNLRAPKLLLETVAKNVSEEKYTGYVHTCGIPVAREAVARRFTSKASPLTKDDVYITSGASGALDIAIGVLCSRGSNILIPAPGFPLYETHARNKSIGCKFYKLVPERDWEVDLADLESQIDDKTAAIVVNNPSNPCGSVYSQEHLIAILAIAEKHKVPVIADEIYRNMVFKGTTFHAMGELSDNVPTLSIGGMAKEFLVPGWRVGWILVHDRNSVLDEVRKGLFRLTTLILGASTAVQSALPTIMTRPEDTGDNADAMRTALATTMKVLQENAAFTHKRLSAIKGLKAIMPRGALYTMIGVDTAALKDVADDLAFVQMLLNEEGVFVLPGACFKMPNYFRIVYCAPQEVLGNAYDKIEAFCARHARE